MQSSFNIIKKNSVLAQGEKEISTIHTILENKGNDYFKDSPEYSNFENLAKAMIENARRKSDQLISGAYEEAAKIEQEALEKGSEKGYKDGYNKGYSDIHDKAVKDSEDIILKARQEYDDSQKKIKQAEAEAERILKAARQEYEKYLDDKTDEIKSIISLIAENFLKYEVEKEDALNNIVSEIISEAKNTSMYIIKCNPLYGEELRKTASTLNGQLMYKGDITVLEDSSLEKGKVIIEMENGRIIASVQNAKEKIDELLNEK